MVLLLSQTSQALVETRHLVIHFLIRQIKAAYTVLGQIYPIPLQPWQARWYQSGHGFEPGGATGCKGHFEGKGNRLCWAWLIILLDATAQRELERGSQRALCAQRAFMCPCVAGSCSCSHSPSHGDGGGLSPVKTIDWCSSLLTSFPCSPTQSRVNKTGPFPGRRKLSDTDSSVFISWSGDFQS